jgi:hypothetical protein
MTDSLHESDFYSWSLEQAAALRRAAELRLNAPVALDWENLAEEVESMGIEQANRLRSSYKVLLMHLLKWRFQPTRRSRSWRRTILRERGEIEDHLEDNPGLVRRQAELFEQAYRRARRDAARETGLPIETFPPTCPWSLQQVMDDAFWPEPADP